MAELLLSSGRHHSERPGLLQDARPLGPDPPRVTRDKAWAPPGCLAPGRRRRGLGPSRQSLLSCLRRCRALVAGPEPRARLDPVPPIWRLWGRLTDHHLPPPAPQSTLLTFSSVSRAVWQGSSPFDWGECQSPRTGDRSPQSPGTQGRASHRTQGGVSACECLFSSLRLKIFCRSAETSASGAIALPSSTGCLFTALPQVFSGGTLL